MVMANVLRLDGLALLALSAVWPVIDKNAYDDEPVACRWTPDIVSSSHRFPLDTYTIQIRVTDKTGLRLRGVAYGGRPITWRLGVAEMGWMMRSGCPKPSWCGGFVAGIFAGFCYE
jgi:hypothetical protein